jgi:hypothetical protein
MLTLGAVVPRADAAKAALLPKVANVAGRVIDNPASDVTEEKGRKQEGCLITHRALSQRDGDGLLRRTAQDR